MYCVQKTNENGSKKEEEEIKNAWMELGFAYGYDIFVYWGKNDRCNISVTGG